MARLSALKIFPSLRSLPGFRPRDPRKVAIGLLPEMDRQKGHKHLKTHGHAEQVAFNRLATLYHDLGVLAFDGCNASQIERIGTILQSVMAWGGVDGLMIALKEPTTFAADVPSDFPTKVLPSPINHDHHGNYVSGQLALDVMIPIHEWAVANNTVWGVIDLSTKTKVLDNKTRIGVHASSGRPGIYLETDTGTRRLPLRARTAFEAYPQFRTETWITTKGRGDILGLIEAHYQSGKSSVSDDKGFAAVVSDHNMAKQLEWAKLAKESPNQTTALETAEAALKGLWELERETWADRSNVVTEQDRKFAAKAEERKALMDVDANASQLSEASRDQDAVNAEIAKKAKKAMKALKARRYMKGPTSGRNKMNPVESLAEGQVSQQEGLPENPKDGS